MSFVHDASGEVTGLSWTANGTTRVVPRIGPLFPGITQQHNEDVALTRRVEAVLRALGQGGDVMKTVPGITEGARRDFSRPWPPSTTLKTLSFVAAQDVAGRGIERHDGKVARILYYRMTNADGERRLLVHLTADGKVTDVDIVDE